MRALEYVPLLVLCAVAIAFTYRAPVQAPDVVGVSDALRDAIASEHRMREPEWRRGARHGFPGDLWSQGDDLANQERRWVSETASRYHVRVPDVLRAIDHGLRADFATAPDRGIVPPCMPRPFYD